MKLKIKQQESFSRLELILRTLFGFFYIVLPHLFLLIFFGIWSAILQFITFWVILFTGTFPKSFFDFQLGLLRWNLRVSARMSNVSDGYPAFWINGTDEYTQLEVEYPEKVSRGLLIARLLFGVLYVYIPHFFVLFFRGIFVAILQFLAWWIVLFTGEYPASFHNWVVGQIRWGYRVNLYMSFMTDTYPAFTGDELPEEV